MVRQPPSSAHALIHAVRAAATTNHAAASEVVARALGEFAKAPGIPVEALVGRAPRDYQRLLLNSAQDEFHVVLALWAPGSVSPIHDHAGLSGAIACPLGSVLETRYAVVERLAGRVRLGVAGSELVAGRSATVLDQSPSGQLHAIANLGDQWAATVHAYLGRLQQYAVYRREEGDWYRARPSQLWFDATDVARAWLKPAEGSSSADLPSAPAE